MLKKAAVLTIALLLLIAGATAEENARHPLGIYDAKGNLLIQPGDPAEQVIQTLKIEDYIEDCFVEPYVIYDKNDIVIPEIQKPEENVFSIYYDPIMALAAAVSDENDVLDKAGVTAVLQQFNLTADDISTMTKGIYTVKDIERGRLAYEELQWMAEQAKSWRELYQEQLESYEKKLALPYEQWKEDVESSLTISRGMINLMAQEGNKFRGVIDLDGLRLYFAWEEEERRSPMELLGLEGYLSKLEDTTYATIEERNAAIEKEAEEYREFIREISADRIKHAELTQAVISKFGYISGEGYYVGQMQEDTVRWGFVHYFAGDLQLSEDYVNTLTYAEKGNMGLTYVQVRVNEKNYVSEIRVGMY